MTSTPTPEAGGPGRAFLLYNVARLGLLLLFGGILWLAGFRGMLLALFALVLSGIASWFVLGRQRVVVGQALSRQIQQRRVKFAQRTAAEDAAVGEMFARRSPSDD